MKNRINFTQHTYLVLARKTSFVILCSIILTSVRAQIGPVGGGSEFPPVTPPVAETPPCSVSDNCNEEPNYVPVWRYNATTQKVDQCPSPVYVRKDVYTCNHILRKDGGTTYNPGDDLGGIGGGIGDPAPCDGCFPIPTSNPNCSQCNIGYVGINAIIPTEQLHVIGNVRCQDGEFMGDIRVKNIYSGDITNDPYPNYIGDEEYGPIVFHHNTTMKNIQAVSATIDNLSSNTTNTVNLGVSNSITTQYLTAQNSANLGYVNANYLNVYGNITASGTITTTGLTNNGNTNIKGVLRVKNASGANVFSVNQNGEIRSRKTVVDLQTIPDYVFHSDYTLMPLSDLESYIQKEKHLPNIKSEKEYQKEGGIDVGELNLKLLEKVEELTLHLIKQEKRIKELERREKKIRK